MTPRLPSGTLYCSDFHVVSTTTDCYIINSAFRGSATAFSASDVKTYPEKAAADPEKAESFAEKAAADGKKATSAQGKGISVEQPAKAHLKAAAAAIQPAKAGAQKGTSEAGKA